MSFHQRIEVDAELFLKLIENVEPIFSPETHILRKRLFEPDLAPS
ncbi:MAG TPA: hypothetical protein VF702_07445 [Allosphingosinicella sp.]